MYCSEIYNHLWNEQKFCDRDRSLIADRLGAKALSSIERLASGLSLVQVPSWEKEIAALAQNLAFLALWR